MWVGVGQPQKGCERVACILLLPEAALCPC
jgi:hypothetical protein